MLYGWGRAAEGQLGTNPSTQINKPLKMKLPADTDVFKLSGNFTFLIGKKDGILLINYVDEKSHKLEWREVTNRRVWGLSTVEGSVILIASASKDRIPLRESEHPIT